MRRNPSPYRYFSGFNLPKHTGFEPDHPNCTAEHDLWLSSLIQAIYSAFKKGYQGKPDQIMRTEKDAIADRNWLLSDDYFIGSYRWLCEACNLDATALREKLFSNPDKLLPTTFQPQKAIQNFHPFHAFGGRKKKPRLPRPKKKNT